jgi:hypothetical protein
VKQPFEMFSICDGAHEWCDFRLDTCSCLRLPRLALLVRYDSLTL